MLRYVTGRCLKTGSDIDFLIGWSGTKTSRYWRGLPVTHWSALITSSWSVSFRLALFIYMYTAAVRVQVHQRRISPPLDFRMATVRACEVFTEPNRVM